MRASARASLGAYVLLGGFALIKARAAQFVETNGLVVIEAEHFTAKADGSGAAPFVLVPDDAPFVAGTTNGAYASPRNGRFMQSQPDSGGDRGNDPALVGTPPYLEYAVKITTTGDYQLYLRVLGWNPDGSSDSVYAEILSNGQRLPAPNPGWYRYGGFLPAALPLDFSLLQNDPTDPAPVGWTGYAAPEQVDDAGGDVPAVFTIPTPGTYVIRISEREDGTSLDALILQLSSLDPPTNPGPPESAAEGFLLLAEPADTRVAPGAVATFSVRVAQPEGASYQWEKAAPNSSTFAAIPGAKAARYTTAPAQASDMGTAYRVVVTAGGTNLTSRAGRLMARAGQFIEKDGRVVMEAENYTSKTDAGNNHPFVLVPDEAPFAAGGTNGVYLNARADKFVQEQPDDGANKGNDPALVGTAPYLDYDVKISTVGDYQLYLRVMGWDGSSDSVYAEILQNGKRLPAPNPAWYRYGGLLPAELPMDFSLLRNNPKDETAVGWTGYAAPEHVDGTDNDIPAVWNIPSAGSYTIRISQREDGTSLDALILQLSSLDPPSNPGPTESAFEIAATPGGSQPSIVVQRSGNGLTITWTNGGSLQEGAAVTGPWNPVATGGTFSTDTTQVTRFYRVVR